MANSMKFLIFCFIVVELVHSCQIFQTGAPFRNDINYHSSNGYLDIHLTFEHSIDDLNNELFCYKTLEGHQSPVLRVKPGDNLLLTLTNNYEGDKNDPKSHDMQNSMNNQNNISSATTTSINYPKCGSSIMTSSSSNLHFHGLHGRPICHEDDVLQTIINYRESFTYNIEIPINQPPGLYWYHPHIHGISERFIQGGATGILIIEGIEMILPSLGGIPEQIFNIRDRIMVLDDDNNNNNSSSSSNTKDKNLDIKHHSPHTSHSQHNIVSSATIHKDIQVNSLIEDTKQMTHTKLSNYNITVQTTEDTPTYMTSTTTTSNDNSSNNSGSNSSNNSGSSSRSSNSNSSSSSSSSSSNTSPPTYDLTINNIPLYNSKYISIDYYIQENDIQFWRIANTCADTILDIQIIYDNIIQPIQLIAIDGSILPEINDTYINYFIHTQDVNNILNRQSHDNSSQYDSQNTDNAQNHNNSNNQLFYHNIISHIILSPGQRIEFLFHGPSLQIQSAFINTLYVDTGPNGDNDPYRSILRLIPVTKSSMSSSSSSSSSSASSSISPVLNSTIKTIEDKGINMNHSNINNTMKYNVLSPVTEMHLSLSPTVTTYLPKIYSVEISYTIPSITAEQQQLLPPSSSTEVNIMIIPNRYSTKLLTVTDLLAPTTPITNTRTLYFSQNNPTESNVDPNSIVHTATASRDGEREGEGNSDKDHEEEVGKEEKEPDFFITEKGHMPVLFSPQNPPAITVYQNTIEDWIIYNQATEAHVFHIHQIRFLVLNTSYNNMIDYTLPVFHDTIFLPSWSGNMNDSYPFIHLRMDFMSNNIIGQFVYHCHILGHEDHGMMAVINVLPPRVVDMKGDSNTNDVLSLDNEENVQMMNTHSDSIASNDVTSHYMYMPTGQMKENTVLILIIVVLSVLLCVLSLYLLYSQYYGNEYKVNNTNKDCNNDNIDNNNDNLKNPLSYQLSIPIPIIFTTQDNDKDQPHSNYININHVHVHCTPTTRFHNNLHYQPHQHSYHDYKCDQRRQDLEDHCPPSPYSLDNVKHYHYENTCRHERKDIEDQCPPSPYSNHSSSKYSSRSLLSSSPYSPDNGNQEYYENTENKDYCRENNMDIHLHDTILTQIDSPLHLLHHHMPRHSSPLHKHHHHHPYIMSTSPLLNNVTINHNPIEFALDISHNNSI